MVGKVDGEGNGMNMITVVHVLALVAGGWIATSALDGILKAYRAPGEDGFTRRWRHEQYLEQGVFMVVGIGLWGRGIWYFALKVVG